MAYPMTKYRGFRVISPLTVPKSEERLAPEGNGHSGTSTPVDYPDGAKQHFKFRTQDEVAKLRAELEYEKVKVQRLEREKTQLSRELQEVRLEKDWELNQMTKELQQLNTKLKDEQQRNTELMNMLVAERLKQETEKSNQSSPQMAPSDVRWKEDLETQLRRTEERCTELEIALKSLEEKSSQQNAKSVIDGYVQQLVQAAASGDLETLTSHLERADSTSVSSAAHTAETDGTTALHAACETGNSGCLQVLLEDGGNPNAVRPKDKIMPLHLAATNGYKSCVEILLEHKVDVNAVDKQGYTSLCYAAGKGSDECVQLLLQHGAYVQAVTKAGRTPLHLAASGGFRQCLQHLLNAAHYQGQTSELVNHTDRDGWTALHLAARSDHKGCLSLLLGCTEVSVNVQDNWGRTALDMAASNECKDILKMRDSHCLTVHLTGKHESPIGVIRVHPYNEWADIDQSVVSVLVEYSQFMSGKRVIPDLAVEMPKFLPNIMLDDVDSGMRKLLHHSPHLTRHKTDSVLTHVPVSQPAVGITDDVGVMTSGGQSDEEFKLGLDSVKLCEAGELMWTIGDAPLASSSGGAQEDVLGVLPPFVAFRESSLQLTVHLKDMLHDGQLDQLASNLLIPIKSLDTYLHLLEDSKAVVLCGPAGTGKSYLAQQLATALKEKLSHSGSPEGEITHVALNSGFTRSNLLYLMHTKGFLVSAEKQTGGELSVSARKAPSIVILDNLERVSVCDVFAEVLTALNYRGPKNSLWLGAVCQTGEHGKMEMYHEGRYYLKQSAYFIATMDKHGSTEMDVSIHSYFKWIACRFDVDPVKNLLQRDLRQKVLAVGLGRLPSSRDELFRLTEWVWRVWHRVNTCAALLELPELLLGMKLFASCPVEKSDGKAIMQWFTDLWNFGIAPCVQDVVLRNGRSSRIVAGHHVMSSSVLLAIIYKAILPECPLESAELQQFVKSLVGYSEGHQLLHDLKHQIGKEPSRVPQSPRKQRKTPSPIHVRKLSSVHEGRQDLHDGKPIVAPKPAKEKYRPTQSRDELSENPFVISPSKERQKYSSSEEEVKSTKTSNPSSPPFTETSSGGSESPDKKKSYEEREIKRTSSWAGDFARRLFGRLKPKSRSKLPHRIKEEETTKSSCEPVAALNASEEQVPKQKRKQKHSAVVVDVKSPEEQDGKHEITEPKESHQTLPEVRAKHSVTSETREGRLTSEPRESHRATESRVHQSMIPESREAHLTIEPQKSHLAALEQKTNLSNRPEARESRFTSEPRETRLHSPQESVSSRERRSGVVNSPMVRLASSQSRGSRQQHSSPTWRDRNLDRGRRGGSFRLKSSSGELDMPHRIEMPPYRPRANSDVSLFNQPSSFKPNQAKEGRERVGHLAFLDNLPETKDLTKNKVVTVADVHVGGASSIPLPVKTQRSTSHVLQSQYSPVKRGASDSKEKTRTVSLLSSVSNSGPPKLSKPGRVARTSQV
ncbi:cortactin-binding protein 2-like isoform X2 [Corticium candelabrum]|uniref:cortactin-binding protein 2-like isoform X2 n=1 Tax=Corticium candelabrum TaxID=121492 RepID=UPI002E259F1C|nr:cortactin-binding protein 2-like isoform X2 [Corticium candelabrum]